MEESACSPAGLWATSRAFRARKLADSIAAHRSLKSRPRGFTEGPCIERLTRLQTVGGDGAEAISLIHPDPCRARGLGYPLPQATAARPFLDRFQDESLEALRSPRAEQKSFIVPSRPAVEALQNAPAGLVRRVAHLSGEQPRALKIATLDPEATILESHKQAARPPEEGGRGYQPRVAVWAEGDLVPGEKSERTASRPLRDVGLGLRTAHGVLLADGSARPPHAVITNLAWKGDRLLDWPREKAGPLEPVPEEVKNALGGGHRPSQHFHVNAAGFKLSRRTDNLARAIRGLCFEPEARHVRLKKFRLRWIHRAGRFSRFGCKLRLRFCATPEAIGRVQKVGEGFGRPTQATAFG